MDIKGFTGEYRWLSNFWPSPFEFNNYAWPTVEHAYVAHKAHPAKLKRTYSMVIEMTAGQAKRYGRTIDIRPDFDMIKLYLMQSLTWKKYQNNDQLLKRLMDTTGIIEETNDWGDTFWGVCNGEGSNHLGRIIMGVRDYYRHGIEPQSLSNGEHA